MKKGIHPDYKMVAFHDAGADKYILVRSTVKTDRTVEIDGQTYPCMGLDVSSYSHPFYTGTQKVMDTGGRIERFNKRFGMPTLKR
ncbi:type B 50S ribosomal protein L31 [Parendozoicomonas haliclonae]|uniref:Large ribosomal subunit protein bL31B n=1 Tax=Parendozoicomonas haliclonae TaxID=1960125 RepID=A0A1X7APC0_9GAMM|nr:type B 50S ribosomal protein L31 [Parendozoicomonas haliclonae]SMA50171.1 50S ribosomal protein L31 type B [Parendozoicomonas haliclonae]